MNSMAVSVIAAPTTSVAPAWSKTPINVAPTPGNTCSRPNGMASASRIRPPGDSAGASAAGKNDFCSSSTKLSENISPPKNTASAAALAPPVPESPPSIAT